MADFSKPQLTDLYADVLASVRDLIAECVKFQDGGTNTNVPVGAVRFSSTNRRFEKWNGSAWLELIPKATAKYDINVDRVDGFDAGNASGNIPVSNGLLNVNLNAALLGGNAASAFVVAPPNGTGGVRRLYRNEDNSPYNVQTYYTGTRWRMRGYLNDTFHAEAEVAYADTAGFTSSAATANYATTANNATTANYATSSGYSSNTGSIAGAIGNGYGWTGRQEFTGGGESFSAAGGQGKIEIKSSGNFPAVMAFHRPGVYATYFGLDTDNQFKWGGWSGGGPHVFWTTANLNPANYAPNTHGHAQYIANIDIVLVGGGGTNAWYRMDITRGDATSYSRRITPDFNDSSGGGD